MRFIVTATALVVLVYAGSCWLFPFARCARPRCDGGRIYRPDRAVFRECRRCKGSGRRLRVGRRLFNAYRRRRARIS